MKNKKYLTWLIVSIICIIGLSISMFFESSFTYNNDFLWALNVCVITISFLGIILSLGRFFISVFEYLTTDETEKK